MFNPFAGVLGSIGEGVGAFRFAQSKPFLEQLAKQQAELQERLERMEGLARKRDESRLRTTAEITRGNKLLDSELEGISRNRQTTNTIAIGKANAEITRGNKLLDSELEGIGSNRQTANTIAIGKANTDNQGYLLGVGADALGRVNTSATGDAINLEKARHGNTMEISDQRYQQLLGILGKSAEGDLATSAPIFGNNPNNPVVDRYLAHMRDENAAERKWIGRLVRPPLDLAGDATNLGLDLASAAGSAALLKLFG